MGFRQLIKSITALVSSMVPFGSHTAPGPNDTGPIQPDMGILLWYCLAMVTGAIGGCSAAAITSVVSRQKLLLGLFIAYLWIGAFAGVIALTGCWYFGVSTTNEVLRNVLIVSTAAPLFLAAHNGTARFVLKRFGIEVVVQFRKAGEQNGDKPSQDTKSTRDSG